MGRSSRWPRNRAGRAGGLVPRAYRSFWSPLSASPAVVWSYLLHILRAREPHELAVRGGRPDTSGRNKPNRSDAGPLASRRAGAGVRGQSSRASVSRKRPQGAGAPTPQEKTSPTGAMPVRRRRGGRERGFGGRAPEHLFLESDRKGRAPRHLRKKPAQPERCRSAGVAEGGSGGSGAELPSICFSRAAARGGHPDTSGENKPNRSDAGPPASRRAGAGVRGQSPRASVSREASTMPSEREPGSWRGPRAAHARRGFTESKKEEVCDA